MPVCAQSISLEGPFDADGVTRMARTLWEKQGAASNLACVYVTREFLPHLEEFCDILRVDGRIVDVVGCTGIELEESSRPGQAPVLSQGCSVFALHAPETEITLEPVLSPESCPPDAWNSAGGPPLHVLALFDPMQFPIEGWLQKMNSLSPAVSCVGGLASGANGSSIGVFHNGQILPGGIAVGLRGGGLGMKVLISQGCRPIGEPLTVTKAENNVIYSLGGQPAYQALETAFQTLSNEEKATARGNLFAGLATTEYVDDFDAGDFLIRNIIGADPNSGAVVIGGLPRIGQTLQYQFRDRTSSSQDLHASLNNLSKSMGGSVIGSLLFRCAARGRDFFGATGHDLGMMQQMLGPHPSTAFACNGEIGPLHSVNCLTSYTASAAIFLRE
jgi:small ligand-binding sensory domain FIST